MRTTSVNSAIHAGEGCVIAFPRRKTISINTSAPEPSAYGNSVSGRDDSVTSAQVQSSRDALSLDGWSPDQWRGLTEGNSHREADLIQFGSRSRQSGLFPSRLSAQLADPAKVPLVADSQMFLPRAAGMAGSDGPVQSLSGLAQGSSADFDGAAFKSSDTNSVLALTDSCMVGTMMMENGSGPDHGKDWGTTSCVTPSPEVIRKAAVARLVSVHDSDGHEQGVHKHSLHDKLGGHSGPSDLASAVAALHIQNSPEQRCSVIQAGDGLLPPVYLSESSQYIAQMAQELARMARGSRLDLLAYFLDMAELEARMHSSAGVQRA